MEERISMADLGTLHRQNRERGDRIKKLKEELNNMFSGDVVFRSSPALTADVEAEVLEDILAFESVGKGISLFEGLQQNGLDLPHPDEMGEFQSQLKAMEVLKALAEIGIFCIGFNGMSGRKLYRTLWNQTLWEGCYVRKRHPGAITLIDVSRRMPRAEIQEFLDGLMKQSTIH